MCQVVQTEYGLADWCELDIFFPFLSIKIPGPISILSHVKQTGLPLAIQYNTAPRSTRYTSRAQENVRLIFSQFKKFHF